MHRANVASSLDSIPSAVGTLYRCLLHTLASWGMVRVWYRTGCVHQRAGPVGDRIPISIYSQNQTVFDDPQYFPGFLQILTEVLKGINFPGKAALINTHLHPGYHCSRVLVQVVVGESLQIQQAIEDHMMRGLKELS